MFSILGFSILQFLLIFPHFILADTFFGFCTALTAHLLGDKTIKEKGYLSLNPSKYQNVGNIALFLGVIILTMNTFNNGVITAIVFLGLMSYGLNRIKNIPLTPNHFKHPTLYTALALFAGPVGAVLYSFLILLYMQAVPFVDSPTTFAGKLQSLLWLFMSQGSTLGIFIGVISLIPLLPQTGGRITLLLIPDEYEEAKDFYITYGSMLFLILIILPRGHGSFSNTLSTITNGIKIMLQALAAKII